MSESIKNQRATLLRMAGNIACGLVSNPDHSSMSDDAIAQSAVAIARTILNVVGPELADETRQPTKGEPR